MTAHTPETVVRRLIEDGFNSANLDVADELIAEDLLEHQWYGPNHAPGPEGVKAVIRSLRRASPTSTSRSRTSRSSTTSSGSG